MNSQVVRVTPQAHRLPLSELLAKVKAAYPGRDVMSMTIDAEADHAVSVALVALPAAATSSDAKSVKAKRRRGEVRYFNPYDGALLSRDDLNGQAAFQTIEHIHRGMVAGTIGRTVVGTSALLLSVMALAGLYLRWPRRCKLQWRSWFKLNYQLQGRAFLWNMHTVIATCVLPLILLSSFTGSYQAFDWYRKGVMALVRATPSTRDAINFAQPAGSLNDNIMNLDAVWSTFQTGHQFKSATVVFPQPNVHEVEIRYLAATSPHERAFSLATMHPVTGETIKQDDYADKSMGNRFVTSILPLHTGTYFGITGRLLILLSALTMPFFAITGWMMYWHRRSRRVNLPVQVTSLSQPR